MKKIVHLNFMNSINKNGHPRNRKKRERNKECSEKKKKKKKKKNVLKKKKKKNFQTISLIFDIYIYNFVHKYCEG